MGALTLFGLFAVTAVLVCYVLEDRSLWFILAFTGACALGLVYGFAQGAWLFGLIEAIWSLVALWRSYRLHLSRLTPGDPRPTQCAQADFGGLH